MKKTCPRCKKTKDTFSFYRLCTSKDGLSRICKDCKDNAKKRYERTKKGLATRIYSSQKTSSKRRGHEPPSYTKSDLLAWMDKQGVDDMISSWAAAGYSSYMKPSVDRIDDYLPYTIENIQLVTWGENLKKYRKDVVEGRNTKTSKKVLQFTKNDKLVSEYHSAMQAERKTGIPHSNILANIRGTVSSAGGYVWK